MEETITLNELLARIVRSWKRVCAAAVIVAVLLGGFQAYRMVSQARSPANTPEAIEARYQSALETYETQRASLNRNLELNQKALSAKEEYEANSLLMTIDPYDEYRTSIVLSLTDISGEGAVQGASQYQQTSADYLVQTIASQYTVLWESMDLPGDLNLPEYENTPSKYLSEVISVTTLDGGLVSIEAVGANAEQSQKLAQAVCRYLQDHHDTVSESSYSHTLSVVSESTKNMVDDKLITLRATLETDIKAISDLVGNLQTQLDDLAQPAKESVYTTATIVKSALKYVVLGAVLGLMLACFWMCCVSVFGSRVGSTRQLERAAGLTFLGSLALPRNPLDRLANHMLGERAWRDAGEAGAYLGRRVKALQPDGGRIVVLSTLSGKQVEESLQALAEVLKASGYTVTTVPDATHNPEAVSSLAQAQGIVLAEAVDRTRLEDVQDMSAQVRKANQTLLGFVAV